MRYLNEMKPVNHIFLFRSNVDIANNRLNAHVKDSLQSTFKHEVIFDGFGRAIVDKQRRIVVKETSTGKQPHQQQPSAHEPQAKTPRAERMSPQKFAASDDEIDREKNQGKEEDITNSPKEKNPHVDRQNWGTTSNPTNCEEVRITTKDPLDDPWIPELNLTLRERGIIADGKSWMNDRIINAAMRLCRKINGLQDVIIGTHKGFKYYPGQLEFVQILHVRNNHWITISNAGVAPRKARIYYAGWWNQRGYG